MFGWIMLDDLKLILLLALFVIIPLAVPFVPFPKESGLLRDLFWLVMFLQPFAALLGGASLVLDTGLLAAACAIAWLLFTVLMALIGMIWLLHRSARQMANACLAIALVYVPIGSLWLVFDRLGIQPLGFSRVIVLLTAVHFHFITLAALIITGLTGHAIQATQIDFARKVYRVLAACMLVGPILVAGGITLTQVMGVRFLETVGACLLALSLLLIALLNIRYVVPATVSLLTKGLLFFSSMSVVMSMLFAGAYTLGAETGVWTITISQMIIVHGWVNALAFGFCGLLGWRLKSEQHEE
jgi:hypothetical protein